MIQLMSIFYIFYFRIDTFISTRFATSI
uniref:Uncharacterized protein n=1 Tax=Arundo donax TaxID=35708 RepID=A0A0A9BIN5_ARUDO